MIDHQEYNRCKTRADYEFEPVYVSPSARTQQQFEALVSIATVHFSQFKDGRHWVAVHPQNQGALWWYDCGRSLTECINGCWEKAVRFRILPRGNL